MTGRSVILPRGDTAEDAIFRGTPKKSSTFKFLASLKTNYTIHHQQHHYFRRPIASPAKFTASISAFQEKRIYKAETAAHRPTGINYRFPCNRKARIAELLLSLTVSHSLAQHP